MAAAAGKEELNRLAVEEDFSTFATLVGRKLSGWEDRKREVQTRVQEPSCARPVIWASSGHSVAHLTFFEGQVAVDIRVICP